MPVFSTREDIANRALQLCGARRITSLTDTNSKGAGEINACYDQLRVTEMSDHYWVFTLKRVPLRPIDSTTRLLVPPDYAAATTYLPGMIVADGGDYWVSTDNDNLGNTPGADGEVVWERYFGPLSVMAYDSAVTYNTGELVYKVTGAGVYVVYASLQDNNSSDPATVEAFDSTQTYYKNQIVSESSTNYQSLVDLNLGQTPPSASYWTATTTFPEISNKWIKITSATLKPILNTYPIGAGPSTDSNSRNVYRLPNGYLRRAPQNPKGGNIRALGAPSFQFPNDWLYEGDFFVTSDSGVILYRFVADVTRVGLMDPCFCEGLAAKIAREVCEALTQKTDKYGQIDRAYREAMGGAVIRDAIERGPTEADDDPYLTCRY